MTATATASYVVTERAGPRVAGRIVKAGDVLTLTHAEAEYELLEGTIVRQGAEASLADETPRKSASKKA